jgi:hypothetical protein
MRKSLSVDHYAIWLSGTNADALFVSNFEFGSLGFAWNFFFGAWSVYDFH